MATVNGHCSWVLSNGTPVGDSLAVFDFSISVIVFTSLSYFMLFSSRILIQFLLWYETVNSLGGGSAVITTVMSGRAEERSLGRRKATVQRWPPEINGELEMNQ